MAEEPATRLRLNTVHHRSEQDHTKGSRSARPGLRSYASHEAVYATELIEYSEFSADAFADALSEEAISDPNSPEQQTARHVINSDQHHAQREHSAIQGAEQKKDAARRRGTSITFHPEVTLEDGDRHALDVPLPKPSNGNGAAQTRAFSIPIRTRPRQNADGEDGSFGHYAGDVPHNSQQFKRGAMRYALQTDPDELASNRAFFPGEHVPSLTSEMTASPLPDEVSTPRDDKLLSPVLTSPVGLNDSPQEPGAWSRRRAIGSRSFGSMGSVGRRHTLRSGSSTESPAGSFLARLNSGMGGDFKDPEPDDEGQEISDGKNTYILGKQIGYGGFSIVREAKTLEGDRETAYALKIVRKQIKDRSDNDNEQLQTEFEREVGVWRYAYHPYILKLITVYNSDFATFCVMPLNVGGTLFDLVRARRKITGEGRALPVHLVRRYIYQLGSAIRYLHEDIRVVHRDIKPENCLVDMSAPQSETEGGDIRLCDFGMADFITNDNRIVSGTEDDEDSGGDKPYGRGKFNIGPGGKSPTTPAMTTTAFNGSLEYMAPELLNTLVPLYSTEGDIWAFGCVMFTLVTLERAFYDDFRPRLIAKLEKGEYDVEKLRAAPFVVENPLALDLITSCLEFQPEARPSISQILDHEFLAGCRELYEPKDEAIFT